MNWNTNASAWEATASAPVAPIPMLDDPISETMRARLIAENLPVTADGILMLWRQTKQKLAALKEDEMEIRKTAVKIYVPQAHEGTNTVELGNGYNLKAVVKWNYKIDAPNDKVENCLDRISALGNEGPFIAERLIGWTPNFHLQEYRKLQDDAENSEFAKSVLKIISEFLVITDGAPTLEIKAPKK